MDQQVWWKHFTAVVKGDAWEGAVRVPFLVRWPGVIKPNQVVGDIIHVTDLFTTFATLAGSNKVYSYR